MVTGTTGPRAGESLYAQLGGAPAIGAAVDQLVRRVLADRELVSFFLGVDMGIQRRKLEQFLTTALGGPAIYRGPSMRKAHENLRIESRHFDLMAGHLKATLEALGVPAGLVAQTIAAVAPFKNEVVSAPRA